MLNYASELYFVGALLVIVLVVYDEWNNRDHDGMA